MDPKPSPDLTIVLLGKTGVGKSASGNTILGRKVFESKLSLRPVTKQISERQGNVFGKQISVVDTPGILDTKDTEEKIKDFSQKLLLSSRCCLFLVVVRVGRFTDEDQKAVKAAMRALGHKGLKSCYLLFTGGDTLKGTSLNNFIFEDENEDKLPSFVKMFAGACHLFNNDDDDEEQVRELLLKSGHLRSQQQPDSPADVSKQRRVVLLGLPGAGKSSAGNTILRSEKFVSSCAFDSVSKDTVSESATVEGCKVTVVDTPGFTDKVLTVKQLYLEIKKSILKVNPGPHAFVFVVRIGRITETDIKLLEILPQLFSRDAFKYSMVLFTHGDMLKRQSIDGLFNQHVSKLVSMCGGRYCVFDNTRTGNREQVRNFLNKVDEIVSANGGEHYSDEMFRMAETFFNEKRNRAHETAVERVRSGLTAVERVRSGQTAGERVRSGQTAGERVRSVRTGSSAPPGGSPEDSVWKRLLPYLMIGAGVVLVAMGCVLCCAGGGVVACVGGGVVACVGLGSILSGAVSLTK